MTQIAIVVYPGFTALDFIGPYEVLHSLPDTEVRFVWHETGPVTADSGVLVIGATHTLAETPSPDVVLVPGSSTSTMVAAKDEGLLAWLRDVHSTTTWTTSVCSGSVILAAAGLLAGKDATSHWAALPALKLFGANPIGDRRIVEQGKIVTGAGVSAGIDLALWLAARVADEKTAKAIQLTIEYDPQPPFDSGHVSKASAATKAAAAALVAKDSLNPPQMKATARVAWDQALSAVRRRSSKQGAPS